jgi:hypothetical protein
MQLVSQLADADRQQIPLAVLVGQTYVAGAALVITFGNLLRVRTDFVLDFA